MSRTDKKIISVLLIFMIFISQFSIVFAETEMSLQTLENYLINSGVDANEDGVLSSSEWASVKNLSLDGTKVDITGIEKAVNLRTLYIEEMIIDDVDFSKFTQLEELNIRYTEINECNNIEELNNLRNLCLYGCEFLGNSKLNLTKLTKLEELEIEISNDMDELDISTLSNLISIDIFNSFDNIKLPDLSKVEWIKIYAVNENQEIDLTNAKMLRYADFSADKMDINKIKINNELCVNFNSYDNSCNYSAYKIEKSLNIVKGAKLSEYDFTHYTGQLNLEESNILCRENFYIIAKGVGTEIVSFYDDLGRKFDILVTVFENNLDTTLEDTGVTAEIVDASRILKSNGELWELYSGDTAEKIDTNVKKFVSADVYDISKSLVFVENTLKNDNVLKIEFGNTEKRISGVQDICKNLYLTNNGELYELGLNYITENIIPKKIKSDVKKIINNDFIVLKDGTTWYHQPEHNDYYSTANVMLKKLADFEIKDSGTWKSENDGVIWWCVQDLSNTLWGCPYYEKNNSNAIKLEKKVDNYVGFDKSFSEGYFTYIIDGNAVKEDANDIVLENVYQIRNLYYEEDILVRTDGTIWTYSESKGLNKITKSTSLEENPNDKLTDYIINSIIKEKQILNKNVISGIDPANTVADLINGRNFNNEYEIKIYNSNNQEAKNTDVLGTGYTVKLYDRNTEIKEYTIVIYGDITGDGEINALDALALIKGINNKVSFKSEVHKEAGRILVGGSEEPSALDALAIVKAANKKYTINQSK